MNVNPETGIRYGVISANNVPELHNTIITCGDSQSWNNFQSELRDDVQAILDTQDEEKEAAIAKFLDDRDIEYGHEREELKESLLEQISENENSEDTLDLIVENLSERSHWECDQEEYEYETETESYYLGYLGGAPLIWVYKSPELTKVRLCSPCIPNGGDLDSPDPNGEECYAVPVEWFGGGCKYETYPVPPENPLSDEDFNAYVECALWSTTDGSTPTGGSPLDANYGIEDVEKSSLVEQRQDCVAFIKDNYQAILKLLESGVQMESIMEDFWLTRNSHGSGFWDSEVQYEPYAEQLTTSAHIYGSVDIYVGDDGLVHF